MANKVITSIQLFWNIAPQTLKAFVKHQIRNNGYRDAGHLRAHIWECEKWMVTVECCRDLIKHYGNK